MAARSVRVIFLFAFLGWTFDFYDLVLLGFVKEPVARAFSLSHASEGWLLGIALGTSGVGGIVAGVLADRYGRRDVMAATVLLYSLGSSWVWVLPETKGIALPNELPQES